MSPDSWSGSLKFRLWLGEAVPNVGMIYELRHYIPVPGKEAAILNRFKNHTFGIFKKNGFKTLNFWIDAKGSGQLWYVLGWESISSMESSWDTFRKDQEWIKAKEATEKDGPIVEKIESILLTQPEDIAAAIA
jgi:heme-degrading monooxygenase HmoA